MCQDPRALIPAISLIASLAGGCQIVLGIEPIGDGERSDAGPAPDGDVLGPEVCQWRSMREIVIDNRLLAGSSLRDVPVLVALTDADIDYASARPGGEDLRFTTEAGALLSHEIASWNQDGVSRVWVRVGELQPPPAQNVIRMFYGNDGAADAQDPGGVWRNDYAGVWHFDGDADDSTRHANHGALVGSPGFEPGQVASAVRLDGVSDYVDVGSDDSLDNLSRLTYTAWIFATRFDEREIFSKQSSFRELRLRDEGEGIRLRGCMELTDARACSNSRVGDVAVNAWQLVAMTFDGDADGATRLYVNGVEVGYDEQDTGSGALVPDDESPQNIGRRTSDNRYFEGLIDEARIASVLRSAAWIAVQHASMTGQLVDVGAEGTPPGCR